MVGMYHRAIRLDKQVCMMGWASVAWERQAYGMVVYDDGNRSTGVYGRDVDHLCLLAPAAEDVDHEVCG